MWSGARKLGVLGARVEGYITDRLGDLLRRMYPDRQILMRAHGEIKFITLSRGIQIGATALAVLFAGWVGFATMSFFHYGALLDSKDRELTHAGERYDMAMIDHSTGPQGQSKGTKVPLRTTAGVVMTVAAMNMPPATMNGLTPVGMRRATKRFSAE